MVTTMAASPFAEWLEQTITARGINAAKVAAYCGISHSVITSWMRGATPTNKSLRKLARGLGVDYSDLLRVAGGAGAPDSGDGGPMALAGDAELLAIGTQVEDALRMLVALRERIRRLKEPRAEDGATDARPTN